MRRASIGAFALAACFASTTVSATRTARADDSQAYSQASPPPSPQAAPNAAHTVSGVVALVGTAVAVAALLVPLLVCTSDTTTDAYGRTVYTPTPCDRASTAAKVGWVAGGGIGLTLAVGGGIVFFMTAEPPPSGVSLRDDRRLFFSPFVNAGESRRSGRNGGPVSGASLTLRF